MSTSSTGDLGSSKEAAAVLTMMPKVQEFFGTIEKTIVLDHFGQTVLNKN